MSSWGDQARARIAKVHAELPADASLQDRMAAIDAAYPFGMRKYSPYKTWLKERRAYLIRYGCSIRGHSRPSLPFEGWARDPATGRPVIP